MFHHSHQAPVFCSDSQSKVSHARLFVSVFFTALQLRLTTEGHTFISINVFTWTVNKVVKYYSDT